VSRSNRLTTSDTRNIFRILLDCHDLHHDPFRFQNHLVTELCKLVGCRQGAAVAFSGFQPNQELQLTGFVPAGWPDDQYIQVWKDWGPNAHYRSDPMVLATLPRKEPSLTISRFQAVSDDHWQTCSFYKQYVSPSRLHDLSASLFRLNNPSDIFGFALHRTIEDGPFSPRDLAKLQFINEELHRLYLLGKIPFLNSAQPALTPRQQQLLSLLLSGKDPKAIARSLGLTLHSVRTYIKHLYQRLGVSGRAELMANSHHPPTATTTTTPTNPHPF
jgi:DNA-binding CsgD family transcriptional regulator